MQYQVTHQQLGGHEEGEGMDGGGGGIGDDDEVEMGTDQLKMMKRG